MNQSLTSIYFILKLKIIILKIYNFKMKIGIINAENPKEFNEKLKIRLQRKPYQPRLKDKL